jgi:tricorn protease
LHEFLLGKANKPIQLRVAQSADGTGARSVSITPMMDDTALRQAEWIEANRRRVEELSEGKLGYIYLPDTSRAGYEIFNRDFYAQLDKQGLIVDERYNGGGVAADYIIESLSRRHLFRIALRDQEDVAFPMGTIAGPVVMVTNEAARSGGDSLPFMFKAAKIGLLVGHRTMGAGVGAASHELIDGGLVFVPDWGHYDHKNGEWSTENRGVAPDIEVEITTVDWRAGRDPQLERAVQTALEQLKRNPLEPLKRPKFPAHK